MATFAGLGILLLALCFDSILGNLQEKMQKGKICDENELMYVQSVSSAVLITVYTLISGELVQGVKHCWAGKTYILMPVLRHSQHVNHTLVPQHPFAHTTSEHHRS